MEKIKCEIKSLATKQNLMLFNGTAFCAGILVSESERFIALSSYTLDTVDHFKINARISMFQGMTKYHQSILIPNSLLLYVRFAIYCQIGRADWLN